MSTADIPSELPPLQAPDVWAPPVFGHHADLGNGIVMELESAKALASYIEGLLYAENTLERWVLYRDGERITEWEIPGNNCADRIWEQASALLAQFFGADELREMKFLFYITFPACKDGAIKDMAAEVYHSGKALDYMCESCAQSHVGDKPAIRAMLLSYAATRVINSEGIHISISGPQGTGKSHTAETVAKHLPEDAILDSRISDKALYYHNIKPKTVLIFDDQELSEDMQELLKVASTKWSSPAKYITVKNQSPLTLELPPKCPFWVSKVNLNGDEQILDRQLIIWTDESIEQLKGVQNTILKAAKNPADVASTESIAVSRLIWGHIKEETVAIPFSEGIACDPHMDPRNLKLLISLIQAIALMDAEHRERSPEGYVEATLNDFMEAARIINPLLENTGGSQKLKLSSGAMKVLSWLGKQTSGTKTFEEIRNETGLSNSKLTHALFGRSDSHMDGLVAVCPAVEIINCTVHKADGRSISVKAVQWDDRSYKAWYAATGIFYMDPPYDLQMPKH